MKDIIFFPFTHMDADQARIMSVFFPQFRVLTLGGDLPEGFAKALPVPRERLAGLDARVGSYLDWARIHKGNERNLKALIREAPYFRDETGVAAIQTSIRQGLGDGAGKDEPQEEDPLVFLKLAEILDRENEGIQKELAALNQSNSALFAELKGELADADPIDGPAPKTDPGSENTGERIRAWCRAAQAAGLFDLEFPVLTTTSRAVMDHLSAMSDQVKIRLDIDSIKVHEQGCGHIKRWHDGVAQIFDDISAGKTPAWTDPEDAPGCCSMSGRMRVCHFEGRDLNKIFNFPDGQIVVCLVELNS